MAAKEPRQRGAGGPGLSPEGKRVTLRKQVFEAVGRVSVVGLPSLPRWVLAAGPQAFMRLSANHGLGMNTREVSHAE